MAGPARDAGLASADRDGHGRGARPRAARGGPSAGPRLALYKAQLATAHGKVDCVWFKHFSRRFDVFASLKKEVAEGADLWVVGHADPDLTGIREIRVDEHYPLSDERWRIHVARFDPSLCVDRGPRPALRARADPRGTRDPRRRLGRRGPGRSLGQAAAPRRPAGAARAAFPALGRGARGRACAARLRGTAAAGTRLDSQAPSDRGS